MFVFIVAIGIILLCVGVYYSAKLEAEEQARIKEEEAGIVATAISLDLPVKFKKDGRIAGRDALESRIDKAMTKLEIQETLIVNPTAYLTKAERSVYDRAMALGLKVSLKTDGHISGYDALITRVNNKERSEQQRLQKLKDKTDKAANTNNITLL